MSTQTSIEWTDVSWNPVRGCSLVSAGCANCYAMKQAHRFSGAGKPYAALTELGPHGPRWTGKIQLVPEALDAPLHWKKPRRIFVNSMSDLFHEDVPDVFIAEVFAAMSRARWHTFQILTKRPSRMKAWFNRCGNVESLGLTTHDSTSLKAYGGTGIAIDRSENWPLPNVWLGVSIENQQTADERIPILLQTPAAVRWVSAEPLLGPVDFGKYMPKPLYHCAGCGKEKVKPYCKKCGTDDNTETNSIGGLDWVVVGGESGTDARPCDIGHIRNIVQQCKAAGVACFVKQLGSRPFVVEGSRAAQEWSASGASAVMDDCGGIHTKDRKGGDLAEWPDDLRVREWPR